MQIDKIRIYHVSMPLISPFRTAFGNDEVIESVLVKLSSGDLSGWGEASPWSQPAYSAEFAAGQFLVSQKFIAPLLLNKDICSGDDLQATLSCIKGNYFAKAAFDLAWWDLYAKQQDKPLWQVLGGQSPTIQAGADFGVQERINDLLEAIENAVNQGYQRIKLKYRPGWELDMLDAVRQQFPDLTIHVDCNSAYTLDDIEMLKELDNYNLAMIEQPLQHDDLLDHATLQSQINTPICLDESITSPTKARQAIDLKSCGLINIKPGRVGGLTNAIKIHNIAQQANIPCWVGGMLESSVGASHCVALATLPNIKYPSDIFPLNRFYSQDLATPELQHSAPAKFTARQSPGIGVEPVPKRLQKQTIAEVQL